MPKKGVKEGLEKLRDDMHRISVKLVDEYIIEDYQKGQISEDELKKFLEKLEQDMMQSFARMKKKL